MIEGDDGAEVTGVDVDGDGDGGDDPPDLLGPSLLWCPFRNGEGLDGSAAMRPQDSVVMLEFLGFMFVRVCVCVCVSLAVLPSVPM